MEQPKRTQIAFDIHPELKKRIKIVCARKDISMNSWIRQAIVRLLALEEGIAHE